MKHSRKAGFSLIEAALAVLILAILAVTGAAVLYQTGSGIRVQGNKRVALEIANQRLEIALSQYYFDIEPAEYNTEGKYYLLASQNNDSVLELSTGKKNENVTFGGRNYRMITEIVRWSPGMPSTRDTFESEHLEVRVLVDYDDNRDVAVVLSTVLLPPEVAL